MNANNSVGTMEGQSDLQILFSYLYINVSFLSSNKRVPSSIISSSNTISNRSSSSHNTSPKWQHNTTSNSSTSNSNSTSPEGRSTNSCNISTKHKNCIYNCSCRRPNSWERLVLESSEDSVAADLVENDSEKDPVFPQENLRLRGLPTRAWNLPMLLVQTVKAFYQLYILSDCLYPILHRWPNGGVVEHHWVYVCEIRSS